MKSFLIVSFCLCFMSFSVVREKSDAKRMGFHGKVKSVITYEVAWTYEEGGLNDTLKKISEIFRFDVEGRTTRSSYDNVSDTLIYEGQQLKELITHYSGKFEVKIKYIYDSSGRIVQQIYYNRRNKIKGTFINLYNPQSFDIGFIYYDRRGKETWRQEYIVDEKGNKLAEYRFDSYKKPFKLNTKIERKYDEQNRLVEYKYYYRTYGRKRADSLKLFSMSIYTYEADKTRKTWDYNANGELTKTVSYQYDDRGDIIRWIRQDKNGLTIETSSFEYNDRGDMITSKIIRNNNNLPETELFSYIFDINGNWISKRSYRNDMLNYIQSRKIEYYE